MVESMLLLATACAPTPDPCVNCTVGDEQNYAYTSELTVAVEPVAELFDITLDWSQLTTDIQGHPVDPTVDIALARLVAFRNMTPQEVADGLAHDDLRQATVSLFLTCDPTDASCALSEFSIQGSGVDASEYTAAGAGTWLIALSRAQEPGAAAMVFFDPQAGETTDTVAITDASSQLEVDVDFQSLTPALVAADDPGITVDWGGVTTDGLGNELALESIDSVYVARFDQPLAELEGQVFDLLTQSDDTWVGDATDVESVALADLVGPRPFPGIDAESTWLFALTCSSCSNPAPRFVTVLEGY